MIKRSIITLVSFFILTTAFGQAQNAIKQIADCQIYDFNDFENGLGHWNIGGSDAAITTNFGAHDNSGSFAIRIRDNSGPASSIFTAALDLSAFASVGFSFSFITNSMETNEDFFLEVSTDGGKDYTKVRQWRSGSEMTNDLRQNVKVTIPGSLLSTTTVFRLRCDASKNSDTVYIDDIQIETCGSSKNEIAVSQTASQYIRPQTSKIGTMTVYPNPAQDDLFLEMNDAQASTMKDAKIMSSSGQIIKSFEINQKNYSKLDVSDLESGLSYLIIIATEDGASFIEKFLKK